MSTLSTWQAAPGRVRAALVFAVGVICCDAVVAFAAFERWQTFDAAPNNANLNPMDDGSYFFAGLAFAAISIVRYLALAGLIAAILRCPARRRDAVGPNTRVRLRAAACSLIIIDAAYVVGSWSDADPNRGWFLLRLGTLVMSAVVTAVVATIQFRAASARSDSAAILRVAQAGSTRSR